MKEYQTKEIRNIVIVGQLGSGKTSLTESMLYVAGNIDKKGEIEKKNTQSDFLIEEQLHGSSFSTSLLSVEYKNYKINLLDNPGNEEMICDILSSLKVVKGAILVVDAQKGIEVQTERYFHELFIRHIPSVIFLNKFDKDLVNFDKLLEDIYLKFGKHALPLELPLGHEDKFDGYIDVINNVANIFDGIKVKQEEVYPDKAPKLASLKDKISEAVAESSEELMEKFFAGVKLTQEEVKNGIRKGVLDGSLLPITVGSSIKNVGVSTLMDILVDYFPAPNDLGSQLAYNPSNLEKVIEVTTKDSEPFSGFIFKTILDSFLGSLSLLKIYSGKLSINDEVLNVNANEIKKITGLYSLRGKNMFPINTAHAGDIVCLQKLDLPANTTLADPKKPLVFKSDLDLTPLIFFGIKPKNSSDADKISNALNKITFEDPSVVILRNKETNQLLIGTQGNSQTSYIVEKLKNTYKVEVGLQPQKIVYRETITNKKPVVGDGKHKKQSGGAGQYGHVVIRYEKTDKNFEFASEVVGGSVNKNYFPAVQKGLEEILSQGVLAGFPVIGVKAIIFDGSEHPVDSNEISFRLAAHLSFKNAVKDLGMTLLEPIYKLDITIKDNYVGDIVGDINKRRGSILGITNVDGLQLIQVTVPESEIIDYSIALKTMTQGSGTFKREFFKYSEVPAVLIPKIVESNKSES